MAAHCSGDMAYEWRTLRKHYVCEILRALASLVQHRQRMKNKNKQRSEQNFLVWLKKGTRRILIIKTSTFDASFQHLISTFCKRKIFWWFFFFFFVFCLFFLSYCAATTCNIMKSHLAFLRNFYLHIFNDFNLPFLALFALSLANELNVL